MKRLTIIISNQLIVINCDSFDESGNQNQRNIYVYNDGEVTGKFWNIQGFCVEEIIL